MLKKWVGKTCWCVGCLLFAGCASFRGAPIAPAVLIDQENVYQVVPGKTVRAPSESEAAARAAYRKTHDQLVALMDKLSVGLDKEALKYLAKAHEEWEEYREAEAKFMADEARGSTYRESILWRARNELTQARMVRLRQILPRRFVAGSPGPTAAPVAVKSGPGGTYTVEQGDSLWRIAKKVYNDGAKFQLIADANRKVIRNEKKLPVGLVLTIP